MIMDPTDAPCEGMKSKQSKDDGEKFISDVKVVTLDFLQTNNVTIGLIYFALDSCPLLIFCLSIDKTLGINY
jgi:hypothetical protein